MTAVTDAVQPLATAQASRTRTAIVLALVLLVGAAVRFYHLEWKVYGFDETVTSLRSAGHSLAELHVFANDGRTHRLTDLDRFQGYDRSRDPSATVASLALEEPQHPPPFFLVQRATARALGDSVWIRRLPTAVFGTAAIAALYWFALRLSGDTRIAALGAALAAVSPFHVVLAQTAREYSLWLLLTCASSALLLEVVRSREWSRWCMYGASLAVGLWVFPLFAFVIVSHAVVVLVTQPTTVRLPFGVTVAVALGAFAPWVIVLVLHRHAVAMSTTWNAAHVSTFELLAKLGFNAGLTFFDLDFLDARLALLLLPAFAIVLLGIKGLLRQDRLSATFIVALGIVPIVALVVPDFLVGQNRSTAGRYLLPTWLAMELAAAAFLVRAYERRRAITRGLACASAVYLLALGIASCAVGDQARFWWYTTTDGSLPAIAATLGAHPDVTIAYVDADYQLLVLHTAGVADARFRLLANPLGARDTKHAVLIATPSMRSFQPRAFERVPLVRMFPSQSRGVLELRRTIARGRGVPEEFVTGTALWRPR